MMKYIRLGENVSLKQGLAINAGTAHFVSDKEDNDFIYPLLRIADMECEHYEKFISKNVNENVIASDDDIIYTRTGQIGLAFTHKKGVVHNNCFVVNVISADLDKNYLFTILKSDFVRNQALALSHSSVQPDLTHDMFKSIIIPLHSLKQQKNIAEIYHLISATIDNNNRINDNLAA